MLMQSLMECLHTLPAAGLQREKKEGGGEGEEGTGPVGQAEVEAVMKEMAAKVRQVHINKFTALCKDLQLQQQWEDLGGGGEVYPDPQVTSVCF